MAKNWRIWSNISGSTGPIFAIFTPYESTLRADDESVAYFPICQVTLPWQPNNVAKMLSTLTDTTCICCTSARKRIAILRSSCAHYKRKRCLFIVWNFREIRSSNSRVHRAHLWTSGTTWPKNWRILSNISGYSEPIFAIFSPYESALGVWVQMINLDLTSDLARNVAMATK